MRRSTIVAAVALLATLVTNVIGEDAAYACGAAYPGGPVMCDYPRSTRTSQKPPIVRVATSYAFTSTTLLFGEGRRADLTRHAVFAGMEAPLFRNTTLFAGAGGIAGGTIGRDELGPGLTGFVGMGGRILPESDSSPFVQLTGTVSVSHAITRGVARERYTAVDVRFGVLAGKTIGGAITPYVLARAFGGPVYWRFEGERVTGTDLYKYQLGGGLSLALFDRSVDVFFEGVALGERGVAAGIGTTFF